MNSSVLYLSICSNLHNAEWITIYIFCVERGRISKVTSPAVDYNRVSAGPPLYLGHLLNDISNGLQVRAPSIRLPVHNVELCHLVGLP